MNKITILFLLERAKTNKKGVCPLKCRITYYKKRKTFSVGIFIPPEKWNNKKQLAYQEFDIINKQISLIKQRINQAFLFLQVNETAFDVNDIYLQYSDKNIKKQKTLLEVFDMHNSRMKKLIDKEYTKSTYWKFVEAKNHIESFMKKEYERNDILLSKLSLKFLQDFDYFLKSTKNHKQITINKSIQRVRKIVKLAMAEGFITTDPFLLYKPKKVEKKVVFLTNEELNTLKKHQFSQQRLQQVKDLFVFCCYTGLAYAEMNAFTSGHIKIGFDNNEWIEMYRQKTKSKIAIPILPEARKILDKYDNNLPKISNQKFNSYLKEIAEIVGVHKNLTHHIARKTFATTVLLYNGVPMEIVSELLGHSKLSITQEHYAKVVKRKVSEEIKILRNKFKNT